MSPKGGIKPHKRFSIQAKRSEVLFVDYMAEHLTPTGRAAIIVPEGIIFQSQTAYKDLRKMLVNNALVAVVSLPAGCFNPYSGVKTSILILDKFLARQSDTIAFFVVANDGFGLGAQRRAIEKNDLPQVQAELAAYLQALRSGSRDPRKDPTDPTDPADLFSPLSTSQIVPKAKIAANGDYNLSAERFREGVADAGHWSMVALDAVVKIESGSRQKGGAIDAGIASIGGEQIDEKGEIRFDKMKYISEEHFQGMTKGILRNGDVLIVKDGATTGKTGFFGHEMTAAVNEHVFILRAGDSIEPSYLYRCVRAEVFQDKLRPFIKGIIGGISLEFGGITIPLPPLEVQKEIVAEIEGYQKVINGARAVLDHYRPHIPIHPDWPMVEIGEVCSTSSGGTPLSGNTVYYEGGTIPWLRSGEVAQGEVRHSELFITEEGLKNSSAKMFPINTVLVAMYGATAGEVGILRFEAATNQAVCGITPNELLSPDFLYLFLKTDKPALIRLAGGGAQPNISQKIVREFQIPLPPLATQQAIVAEIEAEQALVAANRELITRFEQKIQATLSRIWGEEAPVVIKD